MYYHLTQEQRIELSLLLRLGQSQRAAAAVLGVSPSTICRETTRNTAVGSHYHATQARLAARARRTDANALRTKLLTAPGLVRLIRQKLLADWSPEQIAGWLRADRRCASVCAQTIYDWVYRHARDLLPRLHCRKGKYRRTRANTIRRAYRDRLKEPRRITARPSVVETRQRLGDWEGDSVVGTGQSGQIATFVGRRSGYLLAAVLPDKTAASFARAATEDLNEYLLEAAQLAPVEFMFQMHAAVEMIEPKTWDIDYHDGDGRITRAVLSLKAPIRPVSRPPLVLWD